MKSLNVLVVDDDENVLELVEEMLQSIGVGTIHSTTSVYKALDIVARRKADVIISDIQMDPIDGLDFVRTLRRDYPEPLRSIPVLIISGSGTKDATQASLNAGANSFLAKPFRRDELRVALARVLAEHIGDTTVESGPTETISLATESVW
jgi:two-component system, chemotaxis family, chemotaxis protein CheY